MEYFQEVLDRRTGELQNRRIGDWITISELGLRYGVGRREIRAILHHIGVLALEGRRYRLPRDLVDQGIGQRHDFPRSGHAFDVLSPFGQELVASVWDEAVIDYRAERDREGSVVFIRRALALFKTSRCDDLGTAGEVRFVLDHFEDVQLSTVAAVLDVSPQLISRHASRRGAQRSYIRRWVGRDLRNNGSAQTPPLGDLAELPNWSSPPAALSDPSVLPKRSTPLKMTSPIPHTSQAASRVA